MALVHQDDAARIFRLEGPSGVRLEPMGAVTLAVSLLLISLKGRAGWRAMGWYYAGLLLYIVLTFEPMQVLGARFVAVPGANGQFVHAPLLPQIGLMLYSHLFEVAAGKLHYFVVPYVLGLLRHHPAEERTHG